MSELQYLVASLSSPEGRQFAGRFGAGRMTLLLLDGDGRMRNVISGVHSPSYLREAFERHLNATTS